MIDIPDLRAGNCIGIQGFTELPVGGMTPHVRWRLSRQKRRASR